MKLSELNSRNGAASLFFGVFKRKESSLSITRSVLTFHLLHMLNNMLLHIVTACF